MFEGVLVANRGEIAVRIIRACRELGIRSVAVYSEADEHSLHVQLADEAICIGPAAASESYLKISSIISAAAVANVDAIHPGYGFLAENAAFAEICQNCNITFIGPDPEHIRKMGDKAVARETMMEAGVPVTPGSEGILKNKDEAIKLARSIGYPVLVKAVAGGGGKGMRVAHNDVALAQAFSMASAEAERAFGNASLYLEKFIESARHVEVQIMGDKHGQIVHLGERDCSIQRRHQKLIEETPCPVLTDAIRKKLHATAVKAAAAVGYHNAGTIEFLYDELAKEFYFMEMNTRIQVEHSVTEEVTGLDLVKEQINVAAGQKLSFTQEEAEPQGHAVEMRVNAEDPYNNFSPCPGLVEWVHLPAGRGIRVDSHVYSGYTISPFYDSMIAKVIAHGKTRQQALARMQGALEEFMIKGVETTAPLGRALMTDEHFRKGRYNTHYLETFMNESFLLKS
ncbi:MAG TPA: acetyl-CoA carboxylase biotin carboxylase subunit [Kiritimatiellia bacterium]|nr:acetyl-CoA carboxylase biotin carboxylase subunit [Kiritimatiellia bacterium]HNR94276.1 acetyl-CoA carboxylase biotin carboxylase subunit [Kiritimatiellia bacterium]HNS81020.1 acetyl-CoA carboxylase biotin carboxylase subunit [Kiritimatiellia bacterium]HPA77163.1 acetyl-CoA carboxylase biotin carboxylase subunit [Kiritimatiellia bacterium]HQQ03334.1 acetyl-CoA carboxylase biotin carboxylase subunit [Kiritimatiellia bacterium]